jgi:hypothetical protein
MEIMSGNTGGGGSSYGGAHYATCLSMQWFWASLFFIWMLKTITLNCGCWILDVGCCMFDIGYWIFDVRQIMIIF